MNRRAALRIAVAALLLPAAGFAALPLATQASTVHVLRVGTYKGIAGQYTSIQAAVNAAQPGDWILIGPGDYHERQDYTVPAWPAGVWISKSNLHLRGMNRNTVIVDGTKPTATTPCSSNPSDQDPGPLTAAEPSGQGRNGIEVYGITKDANNNVIARFLADNVSIDNLTVCNFLTDSGGGKGNEIWWNGGDGTGRPNAPSIGLRGYEGSYLTATSSYSSSTNGSIGPCCGTGFPAANYGIFSSNSTGPVNGPAHGKFSSWTYSYASNMADSDFYIGACVQVCDAVMNYDHGQYSSLCISTTNAGGYLLVNHMECDLNKDGPVSNSQNNDDAPSPQIGLCDTTAPSTEPQTGVLGTKSCTVWEYSKFHDNNVFNVPGNSNNGLAGAGPVGTGLILAGTTYITLYHNSIYNNKAWGELIVDLPDPESGPSMCQGGTDVLLPTTPPTEACYYQAFGNVSLSNAFSNNGGYGKPTNGDVALATRANNPGNCFADSGTPTTDPPGIETNPAYAPTNKMCTTPNAGDQGALTAEAECSAQLLAPCPSITPLTDYPRADPQFPLVMPGPQTTMPNPCVGVPPNPWCGKSPDARVGAASGAAMVAAIAVALGVAAVPRLVESHRRRVSG